ncbi:hypothetical protein PINS_up002179 [Pythium insidiosum]|nr:hypothetical protein PINS_up002179 [Pythium insidiosum]
MAANLGGGGDDSSSLHMLHSLRVDGDASADDEPQTPSPTGAQIGDDDDMDMDMDLGSLDDVDDMVNPGGGYQAVGQDDDDAHDETELHRHRLNASLAQLPKRADEETSYSSTRQATFVSATTVANDNEGFDYFYDSPANSPIAAASSTALVVASSSPTTPFVGPVNNPGRSTGRSPTRSARNRNPFTGLSNQGATCYMNSLLQTMFMTPELRLGLYRWQCMDDDDEAEEDNIPLQLQKLFANLQLTTEESISTKALTKSFGWTGADVFQQHDVQELCRVLFDALERSFKGTVNETLVNDLYQGTMKDYVKCLECGYESSRNDEFLDLSLVIRPFGSSQMMKSVEEAIELYLKPEVLNGENQWLCDQCKTKRDAIKGLKFSKLPYLLSLQLKRFDYDFMTDSRIKLHDRVTFPKYLDMNAYLHGDESNGTSRGKIARKLSMERHELEGQRGGNTLPNENSSEGATARVHRLSSMDETQPMQFGNASGTGAADSIAETWSASFDPELMIQRCGPYVYELYSVLIHSGSALGGHYYAYIKSFEDGKWYDFNDSSVSELSEAEVKKAWGGNGSSSYGGRITYSTCAYMLMYRLVSKEKNMNAVPKDCIPSHMIQRMREEEERLKRQELERIEMSKKMLLKFFMKTNIRGKLEKSIYVYKTATLREALEIAHKAFEQDLGKEMPSVQNTRLRVYNDYNGHISDAFEGKEDKSLQSLQMYSSYQLYLEVKKDDEEWESFDSSKIQVFVRKFVLPSDTNEGNHVIVDGPDMSARYMQLDPDGNLESLLKLIRSKFCVDPAKAVRVLSKTGSSYTSASPVKIYNRGDQAGAGKLRLRMDLHLSSNMEVFFEECESLSDPSPAADYFEREINTIKVKVFHAERPTDELLIDRRETVRTLKERISGLIDLPSDQFKLLRGNVRAGIEIKTIDSTLFNLSMSNGQGVYVQPGTPLMTGEYLFRLMLFKPSPKRLAVPILNATVPGINLADVFASHTTVTAGPTIGSEASASTMTVVNNASSDADQDLFDLDEVLVRVNLEEHELAFVSQIKVGEEMRIDEIRANACDVLKQKGMIDANVEKNQVRIRNLLTTTMTQILPDGRVLKEASVAPVYEGRGIVAQVLPFAENIVPEHRIFEVVFVDRKKWRFSKKRRFELIAPHSPEAEFNSSHPPVSVDIPAKIAEALMIPPEQVRFAIVTMESDTYDICEIYKTEFDTWEQCMKRLDGKKDHYQLLVFATDVDDPIGGFSARERMHIQDFLVKKREEASKSERTSYSSYPSRKPRETALVIRTKSKTGEKKGGSTASSRSNGTAGVSIRTPTQKSNDDSQRPTVSSDTDDEEDDVEFMS